MGTDVHELLGDEAESLLTHRATAFPQEGLVLPGPDFIDRVLVLERPSDRRAAQPREHVRPRAARGDGLPLDPPGRPGDRALGRRELLEEPPLLRPGAIRRARHRRPTATRVATTLGGLGIVVPQVRPQDPVHREAQPQRTAHLPEPERTRCPSARCGRPSTSAPSASGPRSTSARRSRTRQIREVSDDVRRGAPPRAVHRAVVLPAQPGLQDPRGRLPPRLPTSPGRPTTSA